MSTSLHPSIMCGIHFTLNFNDPNHLFCPSRLQRCPELESSSSSISKTSSSMSAMSGWMAGSGLKGSGSKIGCHELDSSSS
ncbi:protein sel-1 2-like [Pyrus ussuriensis x Pyrus communis]|uniref:Protein sel-1 2-like n=1 Tax=Pyrus ussuriensis x Pyrus communis TaxID=2448454 RepID=A0A5N5HCH6_9ROSA|nr:protein sel-1 2-like [Pyrus ussuriensis x Pyrus communis]